MIFEFKNLGSIKEAQIEMGKLTVICGKNNTGKTYLTYAVYGFFNQFIYSFFKTDEGKNYMNNLYLKLLEDKFVDFNIDEVVNILKIHYVNIFDNFFGSNSNAIKKGGFSLNLSLPKKNFFKEIDDEEVNVEQVSDNLLRIRAKENFLKFGEIQKIIYSHDFHFLIVVAILGRQVFQRTFIISSERTGIQLFHRELDGYRQYERIKSYDIQSRVTTYPLAIEDNIRFQRDISELIKTIEPLNADLIQFLENQLLNINSYEIDTYDIRSIILKNKDILPFNLASSSIHALTDLYFLLKHRAQAGDLLMIDEPELNLHPENQIKMARLFAKLVNAGIRVWITTHSDYIIKELNNCIMLGNVSNRAEILEKYKGEYSENDILKAEDLKAYIAYNLPDGGSTVRKIEIDKYGMVESTFDETIDKMNEISQTFADNID